MSKDKSPSNKPDWYESAFVDAILLSIIRAHEPSQHQSEGERLAQAQEALFGRKRRPGRYPLEEHEAVFAIVQELEKPKLDRLRRAVHPKRDATDSFTRELQRQPLSARKAAEKFSHLSEHEQSKDSKIDRLRDKARTAIENRHQQYLANVLDPSSSRAKTAIAILERLDWLGVKSKSYWDRKNSPN